MGTIQEMLLMDGMANMANMNSKVRGIILSLSLWALIL